jgi:Holliday junction resolvase RusA-like endonuclease
VNIDEIKDPKLRERIAKAEQSNATNYRDQEDAARRTNGLAANHRQELRADDPEPTQRSALVGAPPRKVPRWWGAANSFEIIFRVFAVRPADWDGYECKQLQDMVVHAGILPDDNWRILQGRVVSGKAHSKDEERVEIEIVPL